MRRNPKSAALLAMAVGLTVPAAARAESIVPPENSAAAQYTEAFPTGGGEQDVNKGSKHHRTPSETIGKRNTHKLESKGPAGRAVAHLAAETAPAAAGSGNSSSSALKPAAAGGPEAAGQGAGRSNPAGGAAAGSARQSGTSGAAGASGTPKGSSGLAEVVSQATGSSSGELGLWLPIAIAATAAWALSFLWLRKRRNA